MRSRFKVGTSRHGFYTELCQVAEDRGLQVGLFASSKRLTVLRVARPDGLLEHTQKVGSSLEAAAKRLLEVVRPG